MDVSDGHFTLRLIIPCAFTSEPNVILEKLGGATSHRHSIEANNFDVLSYEAHPSQRDALANVSSLPVPSAPAPCLRCVLSGRLRLSAVTREDAGKYSIQATNAAGEATSIADLVVTDQVPLLVERRLTTQNLTEKEVSAPFEQVSFAAPSPLLSSPLLSSPLLSSSRPIFRAIPCRNARFLFPTNSYILFTCLCYLPVSLSRILPFSVVLTSP